MLRKSTMTALAAVAVLGLAVTNASAFPKGPGIGNKGPGMGNPGIVKPAGGIKIIPSNPKIPVKPIFVPHWPHHHPHWHVHYRPRIWYPPVVVGGPTYIASRPVERVAGPCTCLSKEYTPEGAVLFKDRCTNEMAMNPPAQQTGEAEPQQQTAQYQQQYVQPQPQGLQQK
jgi:hypothetical protein